MLLMASGLLFYLLTAQSTYLQERRFVDYLKEFKWLYCSTFATAIVDFSTGLAAVVLLHQGKRHTGLVKTDWYQALSISCQLMYGFHFTCCAWSAGYALQRRHWQTF
jgi:hypothetical protein